MTSCINHAHLPPLTNLQIKDIHSATIRVLEEAGMWVGSDTLVDLARSRGLAVDGNLVRFTETVVEHALETAGNTFVLKARNPANDLTMSPDITAVGMGRSAPFIINGRGRRRTATAEDFIELMKLGQSLDSIQFPGPLAFPGDIPETRVYDFMMAAQVRYSDKPFHMTTDRELPILCMAFGITRDRLKTEAEKGIHYGHTTVNSLSPLALTRGQGEVLVNCAAHGIPISISPTPAAGATGPCSIMGNLILNNAEILGLLVFIQWILPGLPVFYGAFPCASDMRTMNATYGGPDTRKMEAAAALMAKHYGLLSRSNVVNDAQDIDFQAGAESMFNLVSAFQGRVNYIPGCGLLASFASASRAKLVLDAELTEYARFYSRSVPETDSLEEIIALIRDIGPRGNYVISPHTFSRFRQSLHHPRLFSRVPFERWIQEGGNLTDRAEERAGQLLAGYRKPDIDPDLDRRLTEFLAPAGKNKD